ncbi:DUF1259 domain-containing protein [Bacillus marinisedimentorum]|uniref:DUF1259 domain-containing protein n=1 Tax=Bacillus marinisedimentorum TaxID=1821260 RepID=UPI0009F1CFAB|nr:DUF1259 domain-containing protein [Bacillus marinisedimentorum]
MKRKIRNTELADFLNNRHKHSKFAGQRRKRKQDDRVSDLESLCDKFADILKADSNEIVNGVCVATRFRNELKPTILNRKTVSPLSIAALFSFEDLDSKGNALNLGETVILQEETQEFISKLREQDLIVTALHNHWLFENPRLLYIHWESVEPPLEFARKTAKAFKVL